MSVILAMSSSVNYFKVRLTIEPRLRASMKSTAPLRSRCATSDLTGRLDLSLVKNHRHTGIPVA